MDEKEFDFQKELEKLTNQSKDIANASLSTQQKLLDSLSGMMDKHSDLIREYVYYVASDVIDSYAISKPMKSLMEKQQEDIAKWKNEVAPLIEFKKVDDKTSDEKANEVLESLMNVWMVDVLCKANMI